MMLEIVKEFNDGKIDKYEYDKKMFECHKILNEYVGLLKGEGISNNTYVNSIDISAEGIIINVVDELSVPYIIKMAITSDDDESCFSVGLLNNGVLEPEELHIFKCISDIIKPKSFFDIGANEGWYSLHMLKRFSGIICYSFEPIPATYQRIKRNFIINGLDTSKILNIGLSDCNKTETFFYNSKESGAASMRDLRGKGEVEEIQCQLNRLDDVVKHYNIKSMDLIKIDVEGSEIFVLKGGVEHIKKFKPVIFCEMLRKWAAKFEYHPNDTISLLKSIGYNCYVIEKDKLVQIVEVTEETIQTNYFYLHPIQHKEIIKSLVL